MAHLFHFIFLNETLWNQMKYKAYLKAKYFQLSSFCGLLVWMSRNDTTDVYVHYKLLKKTWPLIILVFDGKIGNNSLLCNISQHLL